MSRFSCLIASVLLGLAASASAQVEPKWTASVQLQLSDYSFPDLPAGRNDHKGNGLALGVSRDFGRFFSLEFGYDNLGKASQSDGSGRQGAVEMRGGYVGGAFLWPVSNDLTLLARASWLVNGWRAEGSLAEVRGCCGAEFIFGAFRAGVGMRWNFGERWQLRADLTRYEVSDRVVAGSATALGIGLGVRF